MDYFLHNFVDYSEKQIEWFNQNIFTIYDIYQGK